jgi:hypothetical protein
MGGTSFYRPRRHPEIDHLLHRGTWKRRLQPRDRRAPQYYNGDATTSKSWAACPPNGTRIFYDATIFHSGQIGAPELLSADPATGRLTINAFIRYR